MIEVDVRDVVVRVAPNGDGQEPVLAMPNRIVLLAEKEGRRVLPIWTGAPEGRRPRAASWRRLGPESNA